jgi:hypothetical protein
MRDLNFWLVDCKKAESFPPFERVKNYLNFYSNILGNDAWKICLTLDGDKVAGPHTFGWIQHYYHAQSASLQIAIEGVADRQMEVAVAHEMTHLCMARLDAVIKPFIDAYLPPKIAALFHELYVQEIEAITVKMSEALVALRRQEE